MLIVGAAPASPADGAVARCFGRAPTIVGTGGNDVLTGTSGSDVIVGLGGSDRIAGLGGQDRICGGAGDDVVSGAAGDDRLHGDSGTDTLHGGAGADELRLGSNSRKWGWDEENDEEYIAYEIADGGPGNDVIAGNSGWDEINGGPGNDRTDGGSGGDRIFGDSGRDVMRGDNGSDYLAGGPGSDTAFGGSGGDEWHGWENGTKDVDRFFGGPGEDYAVGGDRGRLIVYGQSGNDSLGGGNGADRIVGGSGNDTMSGYGGNDDLRGSSGTDTVDYSEELVDDGTSSGGTPAQDSGRSPPGAGKRSGLGVDRLRSLESVVGGQGNDVLLGNGKANTFYLGQRIGRDRIDGRGGRDTLSPQRPDQWAMAVDLGRRTLLLKDDYDNYGSATVRSINVVIGTDYDDELRGDSRPTRCADREAMTRWAVAAETIESPAAMGLTGSTAAAAATYSEAAPAQTHSTADPVRIATSVEAAETSAAAPPPVSAPLHASRVNAPWRTAPSQAGGFANRIMLDRPPSSNDQQLACLTAQRKAHHAADQYQFGSRFNTVHGIPTPPSLGATLNRRVEAGLSGCPRSSSTARPPWPAPRRPPMK